MLEGLVLFVVFGLQHLIAEFGDFLLMGLDVEVEFLTFLLIRGERGAVGIEAADMGVEDALDFGDVFGESGDLLFEFGDALIERL